MERNRGKTACITIPLEIAQLQRMVRPTPRGGGGLQFPPDSTFPLVSKLGADRPSATLNWDLKRWEARPWPWWGWGSEVPEASSPPPPPLPPNWHGNPAPACGKTAATQTGGGWRRGASPPGERGGPGLSGKPPKPYGWWVGSPPPGIPVCPGAPIFRPNFPFSAEGVSLARGARHFPPSGLPVPLCPSHSSPSHFPMGIF